MVIATFLAADAAREYPRASLASWTLPSVTGGAVSTSLIEIDIPGMASADSTAALPGDAYVIELVNVNVSSDSTNFDFVLLNINDITKINTVHEVYRKASINLKSHEGSLSRLVRNSDTTQKNKLYGYVVNTGGNTTGIISLEIGFKVFRHK